MYDGKTSAVVVAVYNGAEYLTAQMDSIRMQNVCPDCVILGDDCSTDRSVEIIEKYIREYQLENWILVRREKNIGWIENFIDLLSRCTEDYIFYCDQDDVWYETKCEKLLGAMVCTPQALCMASDMEVRYIDDVKNIVRLQIKESGGGERAIEHVVFDREFDVVKRPGCTYCLTQELAQMVRQTWKPAFAHDSWAWALANTLGRLYILHEKTMIFQRHGSSVTSVQPRKTRAEMIEYLGERVDYDQGLIMVGEERDAPQENIEYLKRHRHFVQERKAVFEKGSFLQLARFQMKWHALYPKRRSLLADYYYLYHNYSDVVSL